MKKIGILNQSLSSVVAGMGHMDTLVIADAGLPIPHEAQRIDLALTRGVPSFLETLRVILTEMCVERVIVAEKMIAVSPALYEAMREVLGDIPVEVVTHCDLKERTRSASAVIRTGEFTPYANVILIAGVTF